MADKNMLAEVELINRCVKGDRASQEIFYKRFASKMFGTCLGYANCRDDAKDILQDGFIKVFASLKSYNGKGALEGWVRKIMINTAIDYYRKALKNNHVIDVEHAKNIEVETSILEQLYAKELLELINKLPEGARIIFNLHVIEGYNHNEIAKMLDINNGTSKSQFSRARTLLQKWIRQIYANNAKKPVKISGSF